MNAYSSPLLIAGGYGVVGQQVVEILQKRHPDLPLLAGGRDPGQAREWLDGFKKVNGVVLDINSPDPLSALSEKPAAVVSVVNDTQNSLMLSCIEQGIPYVDITRWSQREHEAAKIVALKNIKAPVMFASGWVANVPGIVAMAVGRQFQSVDRIDIDVLYALEDKAGPNSAEYADRLTVPFDVWINGKRESRQSYSDPKEVTFPGGYRGKVYRFDVPEHLSLPMITGAQTVSGRLGFDNPKIVGTMKFLMKSGLLKLISLPIFKTLRRALFYKPGEGAAHEISVEVEGVSKKGTSHIERAGIVDPLGQSHLTACGAAIQAERVLGLNDMPPLEADVHFPEQAPDYAATWSLLKAEGVRLKGVDVNLA